jgi:glutathione peroxidase
MSEPQSPYSFEIERLEGGRQTLGDYAGKVLLIVNVASACGLTPQYEGLEALYRRYGERGLVVLGFPSNQFGAQEPGTPEQIASFCQSRYDVSFPLFAKTDVNGPRAHPLYTWLKTAAPGASADISWNFEKFLVGRDGKLIARYAPRTTPEQLTGDIERALGAA